MDFGFEASYEFAVGVDEVLFGFDFGDDGLLFGEWWEGDFNSSYNFAVQIVHNSASCGLGELIIHKRRSKNVVEKVLVDAL